SNTAALSFGNSSAFGGTFTFLGGTTGPGQGGTVQSSAMTPSIPAGVTVNFNPSFTGFASGYFLNLPTTFTNAGTLTLSASGQNHDIIVEGGGTLNNTGTLTINPGPTAGGIRELGPFLNNSGTFNVNASTTADSITNTGTVIIAAGKTLSMYLGGSSFTQSGGTFNIN